MSGEQAPKKQSGMQLIDSTSIHCYSQACLNNLAACEILPS